MWREIRVVSSSVLCKCMMWCYARLHDSKMLRFKTSLSFIVDAMMTLRCNELQHHSYFIKRWKSFVILQFHMDVELINQKCGFSSGFAMWGSDWNPGVWLMCWSPPPDEMFVLFLFVCHSLSHRMSGTKFQVQADSRFTSIHGRLTTYVHVVSTARDKGNFLPNSHDVVFCAFLDVQTLMTMHKMMQLLLVQV